MLRTLLHSIFRPLARTGLLWLAASALLHAERLELCWPTPNTAFSQRAPLAAFIQPTASGVVESGTFGSVRSGGTRFHEGIDLKPIARDRRGEATDDIYAAMDGVVRYINTRSGESNYGRYIIIEHPDQTPAVYTLYAHLARIAPGINAGTTVRRGQTIATMGRSASGGGIPRDRAHLHFEIGVWMTREFETWYSKKGFGNPNRHGIWSGMNLCGIDPLDVMTQWRDGQLDDLHNYFAEMKPAVRLRIATLRRPDFIDRYPSFLEGEAPIGLLGGWEIECNETGLPFRWRPLSQLEVVGMKPNEVRILNADTALLRHQRARKLVHMRRGKPELGADLRTILQQLFRIE